MAGGAGRQRYWKPQGSCHHASHRGQDICELHLSVAHGSSTKIPHDCEAITTVTKYKHFCQMDDCEELHTGKLQSTKKCHQTLQESVTKSYRRKLCVCRSLKKEVNVEDLKQCYLGHLERDEDCDPHDSPSKKKLKVLWQLFSQDNITVQDIDEALQLAGCNLEQLNTAEKILEYLESKAKKDEGKIAEIVDKEFSNLIASLQSRKKHLHAELEENTDSYISDVLKVKQHIEEKKNKLIGVMRIAEELKTTPSLRTCCDLNQVIYSLKLTVENELSSVDTLKEKTPLTFLINCDEITSVFKNIGKFQWEKPTKCCPGKSEDNGQSILMFSDKGEISDCNTYLCVETHKLPTLIKSNETETLRYGTLGSVHPEVNNIQVQELGTIPSQIPHASPQMLSSPDVIIEEIFEDNQEIHSTGSLKDTQRKNFQKKWLPFGRRPGSPELVFLSHVIHPCHFYIRRYSQRKTAIFLEKRLNYFCNNMSSWFSPSDVLELGSDIFIDSKENGMWCRGTITDLIPMESKNEGKLRGSAKYKVCEIAVMKVFMIDFGNSEVFVVSRIGDVPMLKSEHVALQNLIVNDLCLLIRKPDPHMEPQLGAIHPLAVQCSLKDIVPKNSNESWEKEAKTEFLRMVNNKAVLMKVFREEDGVLIVDLKKPPANKISSDMPVSLRDAFVFLELARFRSLPGQPEDKMVLQYSPPTLPQEKEEVSIVVCHVNSPNDFYLQLLESLDLVMLLKRIEEVYKNEDGENLEILCPIQGQTCIAKFEDGDWYRAQVIGLPGNQEIEVKYVDFGNTAKITLREMRKIKDEFLSHPAKAIRTKLAYIEPYKGANEWSSKAKERFEEMTCDKSMACSVVSILQNDVLCVELFDSSSNVLGKRSCSINSQLVEEDLASYVPGYMKSTTTEHNEVWDPDLEEVSESIESKLFEALNIESLQNHDLESLCNKELQVQISHVVSPHKIFIQRQSSENLLKSLQEKMTGIYEESTFEQVKWEIGMYCAICKRDMKQWQRGQINRVLSETTVEVVLLDFGTKEIVNVICLRELEENLKRIKKLALECSLVDIRPAGGSEQWTATACDWVSRYLTGAVATIIIQEKDATQPLPVKIFCKGEAEQPVDISEYLISKGLALRNRRVHKIDTNAVVPEEYLEVGLKQESSVLNKLTPETKSIPKSSVPKQEVVVSRSEESESKECKTKSVLKSRPDGAYKPPLVPDEETFQARISCIGDDGTIYIIPKSLEKALNVLMADIQHSFKCLGLLEPYCWRKGEACVIRGSDTMWYRGKVTEVVGGAIRVKYLDYGYIEKIPQCHLYPTLLYAEIPPFCIPCQLYKTVPVGSFGQPDAVELLQELLMARVVEVHVMERPDHPWSKLPVNIYFDGVSLSSFMAFHKHYVLEDDQTGLGLEVINCSEKYLEDNFEISFEELLLEVETPVLPPYTLPSLPLPGECFPVKVKHLVSPNEVYICLDSVESIEEQNDTEDGRVDWNSETESLDQVLRRCNKDVDSLPFLTDFRTEMPCLAEYSDGLWYRAKLLSIKDFDPVTILIQFIDYGSTKMLPTSRLRQIPPVLMQYPAQAVKALLAGFKPSLLNTEKVRIPYCPEWSMEALWATIDCVQGKQLFASTLTSSPEFTIFLYNDEQKLVHLKLIEMGLAELYE
ncbi:RING finger protein 17 isoform X2 [Alligator mississippiensis]|uniref:RING finger protein 17 isoform X2 n=1 Tax=Alligator mississippiensis TaxID=8496 RepID=UPI000907551C|nr:RING finger protein 17 isoform X2 [Alligator mississippiensis]